MAAANTQSFDFDIWSKNHSISKDIISSLTKTGCNNKKALITLTEDVINVIAPKRGPRRKLITALDELKREELLSNDEKSTRTNKEEGPAWLSGTQAHDKHKDLKRNSLESHDNKDGPRIYALQPTLFEKEEDQNPSDKKIRKYFLGEVNDLVQHKVLLIVGETGSGKTTLINGLVNYILGVEWEHDYRFKLITENQESHQGNQAISQTTYVSAYTVYHQDYFRVPYSVTVVDTPGFGDTGGIDKDKLITQQIKEFFSTRGDEGIDHIDAVCFVINSSLSRLTTAQNYVFHQILNLFGKDIEENIVLMLTFADGKKPQVLSSIKEADIVNNAYFKFNNSALFSSSNKKNKGSDDTDFDEMFWKMGMASSKKFFVTLGKLLPKSLFLTRSVLDERDRLTINIENIHVSIRTGLNKLEQLRIECDVVSKLDSELLQCKDHTYTVNEDHVDKIDIPNGQYITNCVNCNRTCHRRCIYARDEDKVHCAAMNSEGLCKHCPNSCHWSKHGNFPYEYVFKTVTVTKTVEELSKRYKVAGQGKADKEILVARLEDEFMAVQMQVMGMADKVRRSLDRLQEIALRPNPMSTIDYIKFMIENEKAEGKPGFTDRVAQLEGVKSRLEYMIKIHNGDFQPFQKEILERIKEEMKNNKKPGIWAQAGRWVMGKFGGMFGSSKSQ